MNKKVFLYFLFLLFSQQSLLSDDSRLAYPAKNIFSVVSEGGKERIGRVNRKLLDYYIPKVERILGKVSYDMKPRCFKIGVNFYIEGLRILKYIEILEKNENSQSCQETRTITTECLRYIDEVLYLQFRLLIRKLSISEFITQQDWIRFGMGNLASNTSKMNSDAYGRGQLLDIFSKIYDPHLRPATLSSAEKFLIHTTRRIIIVLFRARRAQELSESEQRDFLAQAFDAIKKEIEAKQVELSIDSSIVRLLIGSLNVLELVAIEKRSFFPVKKVLIGVASIAAVIGIVWFFMKYVFKPRAAVKLETSKDVDGLARELTNNGIPITVQQELIELAKSWSGADLAPGEKGTMTKFLEIMIKKDGLPISLPEELRRLAHEWSGGDNPQEKGDFTKAIGVIADKGGFPIVVDDAINRIITVGLGGSIGGTVGGVTFGPPGIPLGTFAGMGSEMIIRKTFGKISNWWYGGRRDPDITDSYKDISFGF